MRVTRRSRRKGIEVSLDTDGGREAAEGLVQLSRRVGVQRQIREVRAWKQIQQTNKPISQPSAPAAPLPKEESLTEEEQRCEGGGGLGAVEQRRDDDREAEARQLQHNQSG